jgi:hypothetical protein
MTKNRATHDRFCCSVQLGQKRNGGSSRDQWAVHLSEVMAKVLLLCSFSSTGGLPLSTPFFLCSLAFAEYIGNQNPSI